MLGREREGYVATHAVAEDVDAADRVGVEVLEHVFSEVSDAERTIAWRRAAVPLEGERVNAEAPTYSVSEVLELRAGAQGAMEEKKIGQQVIADC
jgi:hypothetical protein